MISITTSLGYHFHLFQIKSRFDSLSLYREFTNLFGELSLHEAAVLLTTIFRNNFSLGRVAPLNLYEYLYYEDTLIYHK